MSKVKKRKKQPPLNKVRQDAIDKTIILFLAALRDEYGYGEKRLVRVLERVMRYASYVDDNLVSLREAQAIIEKNTGLKFKGW